MLEDLHQLHLLVVLVVLSVNFLLVHQQTGKTAVLAEAKEVRPGHPEVVINEDTRLHFRKLSVLRNWPRPSVLVKPSHPKAAHLPPPLLQPVLQLKLLQLKPLQLPKHHLPLLQPLPLLQAISAHLLLEATVVMAVVRV